MKTFLVPFLIIIVSTSEEIKTENDVMKIEYEITSGSVNSFTSDTNTTSLIVDITTSEDGSLKAVIPRNIIDSTYEEQDDIFYILIDGEEVMHTETVTEDCRTLTIPITKGSRQIEIIGTSTINELVTIGYNLALATMIRI